MYSQQFMKALQVAIHARVPVWVWGQAGVGKSSIIRSVTKALNRDHIDVRPTTMDPVDMGIPYIEGGVCRRAIPSWLPTHDNTLMAIEELPDAPMSVQCALYQLVLERRLGDYALPGGAYVCATGNRAQDGGNYNQPPTPLLNRFLHLQLDSSFDSWNDWAINGDSLKVELVAPKAITPYIRPEVRGFFSFRKDLLVAQPNKSEFAFCTPRSVEMLSRIVDQEPDADIAAELINGCIGQGTGTEFLGFLRTWRSLPTLSAIEASPLTAILPKSLSECYATATYLAANWQPNNSNALCEYINRMVPEYGCLFLRDVTKRNPQAITVPSVMGMLNDVKYKDILF